MGFYSIRKLLDTFKVSDSTKSMQFNLACHPNRRPVDYINWHDIDQNYDLTVQKLEKRDLRYLCNQFVHSYVFLPSKDHNRLGGFFVVSERERNTKCYFIELWQVLKVFRTVGKDYPTNMQLLRDPSSSQFYGNAW